MSARTQTHFNPNHFSFFLSRTLTPILTRSSFLSSSLAPPLPLPLPHGFTSERKKEKMDGHDGEDPKQSTADMTVFVQNLLQQMQTRFQQMSDSIVTKIDEMGGRINELEQSINDLRAEMGVESSPSPVPPTKPQLDDVKKEEGSA